jgi:Rrf2 family protein
MMIPAGKLPALLEAVLHIAHHREDIPLSGKRLSEILSLPPRFLEPLLQELVKAGLLHSVRGPKGGYCLAKEKRSITVADIFAACSDNEETTTDSLSKLQEHIIQPLCHSAYKDYMSYLAHYTLCDLAEMIQQKQLDDVFEKEDISTLHYMI